MPRRQLLATLLATMLLASALAGAEEPPTPENVAAPFGVTLTCSARLPAVVLGCFVERPLFVLGDLEVAVGVDAQAAFSSANHGHLAPYLIAAWYADTWSLWGEFRLPELNGLQPIGDPDWLRVGFSMRL